MQPSFENLPRPVAFVLSGGVALGAVQVGMLRAVMKAGVTPDLFVGSSSGALNAAFIAREPSEAGLESLAGIWSGLKRSDVFGDFTFRSVAGILIRRTSITSHDALKRLIRRYLPALGEDLAIPTHVTATDYLSGETRILSRGSLMENLLASSAIPFVFPPVLIDGRHLVDGSVSAHVPLVPAAKLGARTLVVLDVGYPCDQKEMPGNSLERGLQLFSIMLHRQPSGALASLAREVTVIYLPAPCPLSVPAYDFSQGAFLIQAGYEASKAFLNTLFVPGTGVYGHPHTHMDPEVFEESSSEEPSGMTTRL